MPRDVLRPVQSQPQNWFRSMTARSANYSITGLHYQFDKSIIAILDASASETIVLEGIEDIDLSKEYIQCKYHETQRYFPSSVRDPIVAFLGHYLSSDRDKSYTLYVHFHDISSFKVIDLAELKVILAAELQRLQVTDDELTTFLSKHFQFVHGDAYDVQLTRVIAKLSEHLGCSIDDADTYFYKNALHEVIRLARQPSPADRAITRVEFVTVINKKYELYSMWLCQLSEQKDYVRYVKDTMRSAQALHSHLIKFIYLDRQILTLMGPSKFYVFCESLLDRFYSVGKTLKAAQPLTLIVDVTLDEVRLLKTTLLAKRISINDGYEHLEFQPWYFNRRPVINSGQAGGRANDIIAMSSYSIRMITRSTYDLHRAQLEVPDTFITTGTVRACPDVPPGCHRHIHVHTPEFDSSTLLIDLFGT
jgi:hypothetical protein